MTRRRALCWALLGLALSIVVNVVSPGVPATHPCQARSRCRLTAAAAVPVPPLEPVSVAAGFRPPPTPYGSGHRGVDLAGTVGQPVRATLAGVVTYAGTVAGVGVVTVSVGGGRRLTYEPVEPAVTAGLVVVPGDVLGTLRSGHADPDTGCPAAACLHWGLVIADGPPRLYADPMALLGFGKVRLLPWVGEPVAATSPAVN